MESALKQSDIDLATIREDLFCGKGYHVIRNYAAEDMVRHIREFWQSSEQPQVSQYNKYTHIREHCADVSFRTNDVDTHVNFFWNQPRDVGTLTTAWQIQAIRNQLEGNPPDKGYLPTYQQPGEAARFRYVASYRVVITRSAGRVPPHCDWDLDHGRIQMCLMLSTFGKDYSAGGTVIYDRFRDGKPVNICEQERLCAGDLVIFRYAHEHSVAPVTPTADGDGFVRMILPEEVVDRRDRWLSHRIAKKTAVTLNTICAKVGLGKEKPPAPLVKGRLIRGQGNELYYDEHVEQLMKIAVREGLQPSHVYNHRGLWGRFRLHQQWQLDVLHRHGLKPSHHFLDLGCGILRLGMPLVDFLDDDRYCGIDALEQYIRLGQVYMQEVVKTDKTFHLLVNREFEFEQFERKFDFAMAQSVFTHMSFDQITTCFEKLCPVMKPGGQLLFTVILREDREFTWMYTSETAMTKSSHANLSFYEELGDRLGFEVTSLGSEGHQTQHACLATFR